MEGRKGRKDGRKKGKMKKEKINYEGIMGAKCFHGNSEVICSVQYTYGSTVR